MRLVNLIIGDLKFNYKYHIIHVYLILTLLYMFLMTFIPVKYQDDVLTILILTDPAAMGLFFMGAIVMLEQSQNVTFSIFISPIKKDEYVLSKAFSLTIISIIVGVILLLANGSNNIIIKVIGLLFLSLLFSFLGLVIAQSAKSLNQFIIFVVPFEILIFIPAFLYFFNIISSPILLIHPGIAGINLLSKEVNNIFISIISLVIWCIIVFIWTKKIINKKKLNLSGSIK